MLDYPANRSTRKGIIIFIAVVLACFILVAGISFLAGRKDHLGSSKVALIRVEGVISDSRGIIEQLKEYEQNNTVKAIVLRVDSPGGGVAPSQEIYDRILSIHKQGAQKIVISMGSVAASGGYYISCAADKVVANPGTLTGSIGVIMEFANVQELFKKIGLDTVVIKTGEFKDIGNPTRPMTATEKQLLQELIDDVHLQFMEAVSRGRNISLEKVRQIADGRIFSGRRAKELGLVDDLGGLDKAIEVAAQMVGIEERPVQVLEKEEEFSLRKLLKALNENLIPRLKSPARLEYSL